MKKGCRTTTFAKHIKDFSVALSTPEQRARCLSLVFLVSNPSNNNNSNFNKKTHNKYFTLDLQLIHSSHECYTNYVDGNKPPTTTSSAITAPSTAINNINNNNAKKYKTDVVVELVTKSHEFRSKGGKTSNANRFEWMYMLALLAKANSTTLLTSLEQGSNINNNTKVSLIPIEAGCV
jgi:hypothetical protein